MWPVRTALAVTVASIGVLWLGGRWGDAAMAGEAYYGAFARVPVLAFAILLLFGYGVRRCGLRLPAGGARAVPWPLLPYFAWLGLLVVGIGNLEWGAVLTQEFVTAVWEEVVFRGVVLGMLMRFGARRALVWSTVLFASMHCIPLLYGVDVFTVWEVVWPLAVGVPLALLRIRTGSLLPGIAVHFANNVLNVLAPSPMTVTGWIWNSLPADFFAFGVLFVLHGLYATGWRTNVARAAVAVAGTAAVATMVFGLVFLDGPRPGWDGPGWNARLTARIDGRVHRCTLWFNGNEAEIVAVRLEVDGRVDQIEARGGNRAWPGHREHGDLVWKGGAAPRTVYSFRRAGPAAGDFRFRIDYRDRYGDLRAWTGTLSWP